MIERQREGDVVRVTFALPADEVHEQVFVVGDFNAWDRASHPLAPDEHGRVSVSVTLAPDREWAFRYCTAGGTWFNDPGADTYEPNEYGGFNGVVSTGG